LQTSGASRRENAKLYSRHCEQAKQSILPHEEMDCFAARAPRNDILPFENRIE